MLYSKQLQGEEKKTYLLHFFYSIIEGFIYGAFLMNEFIFIKSMKGSNQALAILFQVSVMMMLFSVFFNQMHRKIKNKKRLLLLVSIVTRLPLLLLFFFPTNLIDYQSNIYYHLIFIGIFILFYLSQPVILPIINQLLKANYQPGRLGKLFSYSTFANKATAMVVTLLFGLLLDFDNYAFRYIHPLLGVLGIFSITLLSFIPDKILPQTIEKKYFELLKDAFSHFKRILKTNKAYLHFEISFFFYGIAFMLPYSIVTIYFEKVLHLNYSSNAFYKSYFGILTIIVLPFIGKILDKTDPRRFAIITYLFLFLYLFFIGLTEYFPIYTTIKNIDVYLFLVIAFTMFGVFTAFMTILWSIGSSYFAPAKEAGDYQSIHLTLVGLRACFAPIAGIYVLDFFNYTTVFSIGGIALIAAGFTMFYSWKKIPNLSKKNN